MSNKRNAEILASEVKGIQTLNDILKGRGYTRQLVHRLVQITHQRVIRKQELEDIPDRKLTHYFYNPGVKNSKQMPVAFLREKALPTNLKI